MRVRGEGRHEFLSETGENIHHATRKIRNSEKLAEYDGRIGKFLRSETYAGIASDDHRRDLAQKSQQWKSIVGDDANDSHRLRDRKIEERASDRIGVAKDLLVLVRPPRVVDEAIDAGGNFLCPRRFGGRTGDDERVGHFCAPRLQHLAQTIKNLTSVVRRALRPIRSRLRCCFNGVAQILAGALRDISEQPRFPLPASRLPHRKNPSTLRANELPADVNLGCLCDRNARHR